LEKGVVSHLTLPFAREECYTLTLFLARLHIVWSGESRTEIRREGCVLMAAVGEERDTRFII